MNYSSVFHNCNPHFLKLLHPLKLLDYNWNKLWNISKENKAINYSNEYEDSKNRFNKIKEGYELNILKGLLIHYNKVKLIYFEHHYDDMIEKKYTFTDINKLLVSYGFKMIKKNKMVFRKSFEYVYENLKN